MSETLDKNESSSVESGGDKNFEAQASKMGWVPQEKFRGDPQKWVDAETFVKRGEEVLPIVKAELRKTREELEEVKKTAREFAEFQEAAKQREVSEWKAKYDEAIQAKKDAVAQGDGEKLVEAEAAIDELKAAKPQPKTEAPKVDPVFKGWLDENPWYGKDEMKTRKANLIGAVLAAEGKQGRELYDAVAEQLEAQERASTGTTRAGPQRGGKPAASTKGVRSYENLLPEYREQCDRSFKFFGPKGTTEEAWRKSWTSKATDDMFRS